MEAESSARVPLTLKTSYVAPVSSFMGGFGDKTFHEILGKITDAKMFFGEGLTLFVWNYIFSKRMQEIGIRMIDVHQVREKLKEWILAKGSVYDKISSIASYFEPEYTEAERMSASEAIFDLMTQIYSKNLIADEKTKIYLGECLCLALQVQEYKMKNIGLVFGDDAREPILSKVNDLRSKLRNWIQSNAAGINLSLNLEESRLNGWIFYELCLEKVNADIQSKIEIKVTPIQLFSLQKNKESKESIFLLKLFLDQVASTARDSPQAADLAGLEHLIERSISFGDCIDFDNVFGHIDRDVIQKRISAIKNSILENSSDLGSNLGEYETKVGNYLDEKQKLVIKRSLENMGDQLYRYFNISRVFRVTFPYVITLIIEHEASKLSKEFTPGIAHTIVKYVVKGSAPLIYALMFRLENSFLSSDKGPTTPYIKTEP